MSRLEFYLQLHRHYARQARVWFYMRGEKRIGKAYAYKASVTLQVVRNESEALAHV